MRRGRRSSELDYCDTLMQSRRVAVTGIGSVSPLGVGTDALWNGLCGGASGVRAIDTFDTSRLNTTIAGLCSDFDAADFLSPRECQRLDRMSQLAICAATLAARDASLEGAVAARDFGVVLGTGFGGQASIEQSVLEAASGIPLPATTIPKCMYGAAASQVAARFQSSGPNLTLSTACSSGANAVGMAMAFIRQGQARWMLAGGADAPVTPLVMAAWDSMRTLSTRNDEPARACKPFSLNRDGFVLSEGAAFLLLEEWSAAVSRGAAIYAELVGYGMSADAGHLTAPCARGETLAIERALDDAGIEATAVDYINAHGTATRWNDMTETVSIKRTLGEHAYAVPVSSIKSSVGHAMGAAGALECAATVLSLYHRVLVPTLNYEQPDPECDLDYVTTGARNVPEGTRFDIALSNSFGFGGNNAVLVIRRAETR